MRTAQNEKIVIEPGVKFPAQAAVLTWRRNCSSSAQRPEEGVRALSGDRMFIVEVNGKSLLSTPTLERAKLLAQSYLRDGNSVRIRPHDASGPGIAYVYDALAVAWMKLDGHDMPNNGYSSRATRPS
jgi:hypothetical protein